MSSEVVYELARHGVAESTETLLEKHRIVGADGEYVLQDDRGNKRGIGDLVATLREDPSLVDVRANQITRIWATSTVLDELPFVLRAPGEHSDIDLTTWSAELRDEHVYEAEFDQNALCRVCYVNGERWCPWPTPDGETFLPEEWPKAKLGKTWAAISFIETGSRVSGYDRTELGGVSAGVVASTIALDPGLDEEDHTVQVYRRQGDTADDARIFLDWLLDNPLERSWGLGMGYSLVRLFVEAALNSASGRALCGDYLAAGDEFAPDVGGTESSEWTLHLNLPEDVVESALEQLSAANSELRDIVAAVDDPASQAAIERRELLEELGYRPDGRSLPR